MNRRYCAAAGLILVCFLAANLHAQAPAIPTSAYGNPVGEREKISAFVTHFVNNLTNDADPVAQGKARDFLVAALYTAGQPAQPAFMFEYGRALAAALSAKLDPKGKPTMRQRLNVAIVAARAAAILQNATLADVALKLINDSSEPVVLWGMKAAGPLVPEVLKVAGANNPNLPPLVAAIGPAVLKHPSGTIFDEAYTALSYANKAVFDELIKLWQNRLVQYEVGVPDEPAAEAKVVFGTTTATMWASVVKTKPDQMQVMQLVSDQLSMAAQLADAVGGGENWDQLVTLAAQSAGACNVVGSRESIPTLAAAAVPMAGLKPANLPKNTKLGPMAASVIAEIQKAFPGVKAPPVVKLQAGLAQP